jgi:hypothetical protein
MTYYRVLKKEHYESVLAHVAEKYGLHFIDVSIGGRSSEIRARREAWKILLESGFTKTSIAKVSGFSNTTIHYGIRTLDKGGEHQLKLEN